MKKLLYIAALTGLFILPSCLKNNSVTPAGAVKYPSTPGDYWVYKVTNYQKNTVDTVTVSVVGFIKDPLQPGNFTILQLKWPDKIDSIYVATVNDTVEFYTRESTESENQYIYRISNLIVYPLPVGESYTPSSRLYNFPDTISMISSQNVNINLNKTVQGFTAFREEKTFLLPFMTQIPYFLMFTDDFVPGLGIIKETMTRQRGYANVKDFAFMIIDTWQLLYSHLNNPPSSDSVNP